MKKIVCLIVLVLITAARPAPAENYLLNGGQQSAIQYQMVQSVTTTPTTRKLTLSFVKPASYASPTYNQVVERLDIKYSTAPDSRKNRTDAHGNNIEEVIWNKPPRTVTTRIDLTVNTSVKLAPLKTSAPFPVGQLSREISPYLAATDQVPATNAQIKARARELTGGAKTQFDAVRRILTWTVDHMRYVQPPEQYDAMYSFRTGKGNCQNYSHLSAALMRAAGIPVRIVNGVTLKQPFEIQQESGTLIMKNAQGRHSWIEVWFPDLKWVPFDPQYTELFVSNRFVRIEIGIDNNDTENDGLIRWSQVKGAPGEPSYTEDIEAEFVSDSVRIASRAAGYGPRNRLFSPEVSAEYQKTVIVPEKPEPIKLTEEQMLQLPYVTPFIFGNLEFPENLDFTTAREPARRAKDGTMKMTKSFLVETAEYVTTRGNKYAQSFVLTEPVKLKSIGLALHSFSADGQLWVELSKDRNGIPDEQLISTSDIINVAGLSHRPGYRWVDFNFSGDSPVLPPGRYWLALGFTDGPIVNWFFTYGKPTGPQDGTRFRTLFDEKWSSSLTFEFNYRIQGLVPEKPVKVTTR